MPDIEVPTPEFIPLVALPDPEFNPGTAVPTLEFAPVIEVVKLPHGMPEGPGLTPAFGSPMAPIGIPAGPTGAPGSSESGDVALISGGAPAESTWAEASFELNWTSPTVVNARRVLTLCVNLGERGISKTPLMHFHLAGSKLAELSLPLHQA